MNIDIVPVVGRKVWPLFAPHHYMTGKFAGSPTGYLAVLADGTPVGFTSIIFFPHAKILRAYREHRTVVLPDFQGLGLGARLGDWVAHHVVTVVTEGEGRFLSRTVHPRLGAYREASPLWRPTSSNRKGVSANPRAKGRDERTQSVTLGGPSRLGAAGRVAFSHEYIGAA